MSATSTADQPEHEVVAALDVIRRRRGLSKPVDLFVATGMNEATAYRRLNNPGDIDLRELTSISMQFGVPLPIITAGELATLRWMTENPGPDGGPGVTATYAPWDSNPEPADCAIVPLTRRSLRKAGTVAPDVAEPAAA